MSKFFKIFLILISLTALSFAKEKADKKIVVNLTKQEAYAYENGKLALKGWISSGKGKYKTKTGKYRVLEKELFHISNEWPKPDGGAEMPFMLRITWSGVALHLGYVPNRPASHGCVRLKDGFAQELYKWADIGTKVIIKGKTPKWVSRKKSKPFYITKYFYKKYRTNYKKEKRYIARLRKEIKRLSKIHQQKLALKKRKKLQKLAKLKRLKIIRYYSRLSYKKLNYILKLNYIKRAKILKSNMSRSKKYKELKKIRWMVKIIKKAKYVKAHKKGRIAKKRVYKKYAKTVI